MWMFCIQVLILSHEWLPSKTLLQFGDVSHLFVIDKASRIQRSILEVDLQVMSNLTRISLQGFDEEVKKDRVLHLNA